MRIFITGASGLIGRRLVADRLQRGDEVVVLTRDPARANVLFVPEVNPRVEIVTGDPTRPGTWTSHLEECDAVVNLAGAGIADRRWTKPYKHTLLHSRVSSTGHIVRTILQRDQKPAVLVNASAIGYYGETGESPRDEAAPPGDNFLADLSVQWERQARAAESDSTRVVCVRIGIVLDPRGGALGRMITPFRWYVGGRLGHGRQYMSWIHWRDLVELLNLALTRDRSAGVLNGVSPNPVTNREFAATLARALGRPNWLPAPRLALKLALGEFADYLTMSQRVLPARAEELEHRFRYPLLDDAVRDLLDDGSGSK